MPDLPASLRALLFNPLLDMYARSDPDWKTGYSQGTLYHLWHGSLGSRQYARRYRILVQPQYWSLFRREYPRLRPEQVIDIHSLLQTNENGLLDLDPGHPYSEHVLVYLAHYLITRGELDLDSLNTYLEFSGSPVRCAGRSGLSKWRQWIVRDLLGPIYPSVKGIGRLLPEQLRQRTKMILQAIIEKSSIVCFPTCKRSPSASTEPGRDSGG